MGDNLAESRGQAKDTASPQIGDAGAPSSPSPHLPPPAEAGPEPDAAMLRWLRRLVTGLALAMGLGMLAVVAVVWARLGAPALPPPAVPAAITLPDGAVVEAVTFAHDWVVVVLKGGVVLIYDANGALRQRVVLEGGAL